MTAAGIEIAELLRSIDSGEALLLLDLRNDEEFAAWRIEGRRPFDTLHVPYFAFLDDANAALARVPRDRSVVAVCAKGGSSAWVVEMLRQAGFRAQNLEGGMTAYGDHLEFVGVPLTPGEASRFELWQLQRRGKGCLSYVLRAGAEAVVVDPSRQVHRYESFVEGLGARIVRVFDTHVHADHLSGGPLLAARNRAPYAVNAGEGFELRVPAEALRDGQRLRFGSAGASVELEVVATPGHTPGSLSYRIDERFLLTGDALLVRGVGRPDLGRHAAEWSRALHHTLHERLARLSDDTVVLPAHSGGLGEAGADGVVCARLGALRRSPEFQLAEEEFVRALSAGAEPPPPHYEDLARANLGLSSTTSAQAAEWELGMNRCATGAPLPG